MNKIRVLVVEPMKKPHVEEFEHTLENLQKTVGGYIQAIYPWEDDNVGLVCNEDGIALGLEFNRYINEFDCGPILGTFFLCGLSEEDFISLTDEQVEKYTKRFSQPEQLLRLGNQLIVLQGDKAYRIG